MREREKISPWRLRHKHWQGCVIVGSGGKRNMDCPVAPDDVVAERVEAEHADHELRPPEWWGWPTTMHLWLRDNFPQTRFGDSKSNVPILPISRLRTCSIILSGYASFVLTIWPPTRPAPEAAVLLDLTKNVERCRSPLRELVILAEGRLLHWLYSQRVWLQVTETVAIAAATMSPRVMSTCWGMTLLSKKFISQLWRSGYAEERLGWEVMSSNPGGCIFLTCEISVSVHLFAFIV